MIEGSKRSVGRGHHRKWLVAASTGLAVLAFGSVVQGGEGPFAPEVSAAAECRVDGGYVVITIIDDGEQQYDIFTGPDPTQVADNLDSPADDTVAFGPYPDGTLSVVVDWVAGETQVFGDDIVISCVVATTTTTIGATTTTIEATTTTIEATTTTTSTATTLPAPGSGAAAPTTTPAALPATGPYRTDAFALLAVATLAIGSTLVLVARRRMAR